MNKQERLKELYRILETRVDNLIPNEFKTFNDLHRQIDKLVGRPTMTHEFAFPELLYNEISSGVPGNPLGESLIKATNLTQNKTTFIITPETADNIPLVRKIKELVRKIKEE